MSTTDNETHAEAQPESVVSNKPIAADPPCADEQSRTASLTNSSESNPKNSVRGDVINVVRGFCMGAADTVPGVSGGTVALILGHYERLVTAISHIDSTTLGHVRHGRFREAWQHFDGRFLFALGGGIAAGIVCLAGLMHWLLDHHLPGTFAVFLGLILASAWIVKGYVDRWTPSRLLACLCAAVAAFAIGFCTPASESTSLPYLFVSASVAICAMILPGISGAFVMLLFGVYAPVTGMIKETAKGNVSIESLMQMGVFACGCLFGLLAFSRVLRWLLKEHSGATMAALAGLMLGSVGKLWPLQMPTPETASLKFKYREMEYYSPAEWPGTSWMVLALLAIGSAIVVLMVDRFVGNLAKKSAV